MSEALKLGIAGLGTVGRATLEIIARHGKTFNSRAGRSLEICAVSARDRRKDRGVDISSYKWFDDPVALANSDDIDVFVELIGGEEGVAKESIEAALKSGKHVVTANKALIAHHGQELAEAAEAAGVALRFEAGVAGVSRCSRVSARGWRRMRSAGSSGC